MTIWGGSWVSAKAIADTLPPETLTFWRFLITFLSLFPVLFFLKEPAHPRTKSFGVRVKLNRHGLAYTILGSIFMGLYLYVFFKGLIYGFAGAAGVLVTTMIPIITFVLSIFFFRRKMSARDFLGLTLGVIGGGILLQVWTLDLNKIFMHGNVYFLLGAVLWALLTICSQKAGDSVSPLFFNLFTSGFCALLFFFICLSHGALSIAGKNQIFWFNMIYLSVISSGLATTIYFFASSRLGSHKASSFVFLVPSSAVIFSWLFLGEQPRVLTIAGGLVAAAAVYLINMK
ncbi:MAG: DMT family transporter [Deltaproteobacteria bacterium]|nr:DMT family transporter [Deltaproteobacteria bacterium]